jgi:hypothetical protein
MTLDLHTTTSVLAQKIAAAAADGATSPVELQGIRDDADKKFASIPGVSAMRATMRFSSAAETFQGASDELVEAMQRMALGARTMKLAETERQALKEAVEFQIAYIVAGYKSSIERL